MSRHDRLKERLDQRARDNAGRKRQARRYRRLRRRYAGIGAMLALMMERENRDE